MSRTAVILAGGGGSRLYPLTTILPKPLLPIKGKQILKYILDDLSKCGIEKFVIAIDRKDEDLFRNYLGEADCIEYCESDSDYNTAGRLKSVFEQVDIEDDFILHYGDIITDVDYDVLLTYHKENEAFVTLVVKRGWQIPKGLVRSDENGDVEEFIERYPLNEDIWIGVAVMSPESLAYFESPYDDIARDVFPFMVESEERVKIFQFGGVFLDIGTQRDFSTAVDYLKLHNYPI